VSELLCGYFLDEEFHGAAPQLFVLSTPGIWSVLFSSIQRDSSVFLTLTSFTGRTLFPVSYADFTRSVEVRPFPDLPSFGVWVVIVPGAHHFRF